MILLIVKKTLCTFQSAKITANIHNPCFCTKTKGFMKTLIYKKIFG
jgi:hypothetical protein